MFAYTAQLFSLIQELRAEAPTRVALHLSKLSFEERTFVAEQIAGYQKATIKLPMWHAEGIVFPPSINMEQCSSQQTAELKLELLVGKNVVDLTGGFGVDSTIFAKNGFNVTHVEPDLALQERVKWNAKQFGLADSIMFENTTAETFLESNSEPVDTYYIDPSRRNAQANRVHSFQDGTPAILELLPGLVANSKRVIIKASPMLDIHQAVKELGRVDLIRVVALKNECKELLFVVESSPREKYAPTILQTQNVLANKTIQSFDVQFDSRFSDSVPIAEELGEFLYDPNVCVHKAQLYAQLCERFPVKAIAEHTHIFTANEYVSAFPGRIFRVIRSGAYKKGWITEPVNIVPRNFPDSEVIIRKKLGLLPGDAFYLYAIKDATNKPLLALCELLNA